MGNFGWAKYLNNKQNSKIVNAGEIVAAAKLCSIKADLLVPSANC